MNEAIEKRISRRSFTKEPVSKQNELKIREWIYEANIASGLDIEYVEDGGEAFNGLRKSYGMFTNVRSLLLMKGSSSDENLKVKVGYYGEGLVLKMTELGLGSCWVGLTYDQSAFALPEGETLVLVIVFGNIEPSFKDRVIRSLARSKNRKDISARIDSDTEQIPAFIKEGMEAVKLAPSAVNRQNPTLHFKSGVITMSVDLGVRFGLVDLGIAMKHFELGAGKGKFELTNGGQWKESAPKTKESLR